MRRALLAALLPSVALGEALPARETAEVADRGAYSVGVLAPLTLAFADGYELRAHPLLLPVAPNLMLRVRQGWAGRWTFAGEYAVVSPTPLYRLTTGYLFGTQEPIPWIIAPHAGLVASRGDPLGDVLTLTVDAAVGVPLGGRLPGALEAPSFLEVITAPTTQGYRFHGGAIYDVTLTERWRARGYADVFAHFPTRLSPVTFRAGVAADLRVGKRSRLSFGMVLWNADQGGRDAASGQRYRNTDFLPTLDFIWAG